MGNALAERQAAWEREAHREQRAAEKEAVAVRMALANKIVLAVIDKISNDIIRPGPKPEERECYVMAQELRDTAPDLAKLVSQVLEVEANE